MQNSKNKRLFSCADLIKMFEQEILRDTECVELVEGEILERIESVCGEDAKSQKIADLLRLAFGEQAIIEIKPLIELNEIQCIRPSIAVNKPSNSNKSRVTKAEGTFFVIELTNLKFNYADNPRSRYYGLFKYPEVWFVNLDFGLIEVCTKPNYGFSQCRTYVRNSVIKSENSPSLSLNSNQVLDLKW